MAEAALPCSLGPVWSPQSIAPGAGPPRLLGGKQVERFPEMPAALKALPRPRRPAERALLRAVQASAEKKGLLSPARLTRGKRAAPGASDPSPGRSEPEELRGAAPTLTQRGAGRASMCCCCLRVCISHTQPGTCPPGPGTGRLWSWNGGVGQAHGPQIPSQQSVG